MNYTTSDYLEQLQQDREDLIDNLEAQGITGLTGDETITELVPKILDISTGIDINEIGRVPDSNSTLSSQYWWSAVNKLYLKSYPSTTLSITKFLGDEITFSPTFSSSINTMSFDCANLEKINFQGPITTRSIKIQNCAKLVDLDLTNVNVNYLTASSGWNYYFAGCTALKTIKFSTGTVYVGSLYASFEADTSLESVDMENFTINNCKDFSWCFVSCTSVKRLDLRNLISLNAGITSTLAMFRNCPLCEYIDISNLGTVSSSCVTSEMFVDCVSLKHLDMRNFAFSSVNVSNTTNMFTGVPTDCLIIVKDNTEKAWLNTNFSSMTNVKTVEEYESLSE